MADPTLRQLATFLAAVEDGSVSGAARRFNLTQPAASQQLRQLERSLGVRLLERAGGRLVPTSAGASISAPARGTGLGQSFPGLACPSVPRA
jgi:DNA-binding transcriptional LysR family regulator